MNLRWWPKVRRNLDRRHLTLMLWLDCLGISSIVSILVMVNIWSGCQNGRRLEINAFVIAVGVVLGVVSKISFAVFIHTKPEPKLAPHPEASYY